MDVRSCRDAGTTSREALMRSKDPDPRKCALSERARGLVFFLLTLTYMDVGKPSLIR